MVSEPEYTKSQKLMPGQAGAPHAVPPSRRRPPSLRALVKCGVFGVGLFQNGNVRICILPQCEKVLVGGTRLGDNGGVGGQTRRRQARRNTRLQSVSARETQ